MFKLLVGAVVVAVVVIVGFLILDPDLEKQDPETAEVIRNAESGKYSIEGEVNKTGTFSFNDTPTMDDLISAAGGLTGNADERSYFTTYELTPGKTYYIASYYETSDLCGNGTIEKANINKDDAETLAEINGISKTIANSIVSYRLEKGDYQCLEDLLDVYGIGNATYRKIRNYVILHEWFCWSYFFHCGLVYYVKLTAFYSFLSRYYSLYLYIVDLSRGSLLYFRLLFSLLVLE